MIAPFSGGYACGSIRYVRARASCVFQLPLPRLPALQWRSFRFRRRCPCIGHRDHRDAERVLGS